MKLNQIVVIASSLMLATPAGAVLVSTTASTTADTSSGLTWLRLTQTTGMSFTQISSQMQSGQPFDGWRFASAAEAYDVFSQVVLPLIGRAGGEQRDGAGARHV